jgi:hypothetical protein
MTKISIKNGTLETTQFQWSVVSLNSVSMTQLCIEMVGYGLK